jgi:kanamycin kinase/aminoglycoside 3'-phosphotransferase-2
VRNWISSGPILVRDNLAVFRVGPSPEPSALNYNLFEYGDQSMMSLPFEFLALSLQPTVSSVEHFVKGRLGTDIYRCLQNDGSRMYVKTGTGMAAHDLIAERDRLEWLVGKLPVPAILGFQTDQDRVTLMLSELEGEPAHLLGDHETAVRRAAETLIRIHAVDIGDCPFRDVLSHELEEAERRVRDNRIPAEPFSQATGHSPGAALDFLRSNAGMIREQVFTHGDYAMPNILINHKRASGLVDWGIAGVADMHRDFMAISDSIAMNCGAMWVPVFYDVYGVQPDRELISYYTVLDGFFAQYAT